VRTSRILVGAVGIALAASLTGCALLPPLPFLRGPGEERPPAAPVGTDIEEGSCLGQLDYDGDVTPRDELVSCSVQHSVDVLALVEWPGMDELLAAESVKTVWDEVSNTYALKGLAFDYQRWAATACGDAWRATIGWDRLSVAGKTASEIDLLPSGPFELVAATAEFGDFRDGDHRTRCVLSWFDPIAYHGITPADLLTDDFPIVARDCYSDDGTYLQPIICTFPHTDQALLTFDGLTALGAEFVQPDGMLDDDQSLDVNSFCMAAIQGTYGTIDAAEHYIWGGPWGGYDWDALSDDPDPDASYPFGCVVSRNDGGRERGDILVGL
jgi:hypothetical protein